MYRERQKQKQATILEKATEVFLETINDYSHNLNQEDYQRLLNPFGESGVLFDETLHDTKR